MPVPTGALGAPQGPAGIDTPRPGEWRTLVLRDLGAPTNLVNMRSMRLWAQSEGMSPAYFNWLATSLDAHGGRNLPGSHIKRYPNLTAGVRATSDTIRLRYYTAVVRALCAGRSYQAIWEAINRSPWCRGCQGGKYPVALWNFIFGATAPAEPVVPPHAGTPGVGTIPDLPIARAPHAVDGWNYMREQFAERLPRDLHEVSRLAARMRAAMR